MVPKWGLAIGMILMMTAVSKAQLSPGDLHRTHAFLDGLENCRKCHDPDRSKMSDKCLDCHQPLKARIARGAGLHARPGHDKCQKCHVEHQGRDYDLIFWEGGQEKFDHSLTGYVLEGAHAKVACRTCHQRRHIADTAKVELLGDKVDLARTFLGLGQACLSCHADEHRGQLALTCRDCHSLASWKPAPTFDHDKTHFRLTGKHIPTPCAKCHQSVVDRRSVEDTSFLRFAGLRYKLCTDCHKDVHAGRLGSDCEKCHNTSGWRTTDKANFDHNKTRYPLTGMHVKVACDKCHKPGKPLRGGRFERCTDCHSDYHKGQFAARKSRGACEECHTVSGFTPGRFTLAQHDSTDYPLRGAHMAVACNACHTRVPGDQKTGSIRYTFKSTRCLVCHADPHKPQLKKMIAANGCEFCHVVGSWDEVKFDHDKTEYPLFGKHREATCRSCHHQTTGAKIDFRTLPKTCVECHKDPHHGQFQLVATGMRKDSAKTACERCHTPKNWIAERFNHDKDASYKLEGAHSRVPCGGCHKTVSSETGKFVLYKPLDTTCKSCHEGAVTNERLKKG